jgi:hypothetical protein
MPEPFDALRDALVEASNALCETPEYAETVYELELRVKIDTKIDEALELVRTWREYLEEGGNDDD